MSDILIRRQGRAGRITLNRPKALNAVTWAMIGQIAAALDTWADDDRVDLVIIDGAGDRAFAAGGDIIDLYTAGRAGDYAFGRRFWAQEYRLNLKIAEFPKPFVALMHGFVMGGGVGISCHGSHRIVDQSVQIAMPECAIGLLPDVGGSWLLARAPGDFGVMAGLTGLRMGAVEAIYAGFADSFVPRSDWPTLIEALEREGRVDVIERFAARPEGSCAARAAQAEWFAGADLSAIAQGLAGAGRPEAEAQLAALRRQSPLSAVCALKAIRSARRLSLRGALRQEYRFVWRCMAQGDFLEGIRAQVIDKDRRPKWRDSAIEAVSAEDAAQMLAPLGAQELEFNEERWA